MKVNIKDEVKKLLIEYHSIIQNSDDKRLNKRMAEMFANDIEIIYNEKKAKSNYLSYWLVCYVFELGNLKSFRHSFYESPTPVFSEFHFLNKIDVSTSAEFKIISISQIDKDTYFENT